MAIEHREDVTADKRLRLRYAGVCRLCGAALPVRAETIYDRATKTVRCVDCLRDGQASALPTEVVPEAPEPSFEHAPPLSGPRHEASEPPSDPTPEPEAVDVGIAGASARREYERRRAKDEARIREKWGRFGGVAVALSNERQSTAAWAVGAAGEERLGAVLGEIASEQIAVLHDRRIPRSKANIDHIVVTAGGVWVIDAKKYQGRPQLKIEGGILRPRVERVLVGRRDCTRLVDGVLKQVDLVKAVVGDVPVVGALCFVAADWPLIGGSFVTRDVRILWPKLLARRLTEVNGVIDVPAVRDALAAHFKPA